MPLTGCAHLSTSIDAREAVMVQWIYRDKVSQHSNFTLCWYDVALPYIP